MSKYSKNKEIINCIYCLNQAPSSKEHVILKSLTQKIQNNLIIKNVCVDCNQYFGDNLDIKLARGLPIEKLKNIEETKGNITSAFLTNEIKIIEGEINPEDPDGLAIQRALAKIAFNYVAKLTVNFPQKLLLGAEFDTVRKFIRNGDDPKYAVVMPSAQQHKKFAKKQHVLSFDIFESNFVVYIELYNSLDLQVTLTTFCEGVKLDPKSHIFDLNKKVCFETTPSWEDYKYNLNYKNFFCHISTN